MNSLPRILGTGLLVLLAALVALLVMPAWRGAPSAPPAAHPGTVPSPAVPTGETTPGVSAGGAPARVAALTQQGVLALALAALALALAALALAVTLVFSLSLHPTRPGDSRAPLEMARSEMKTLAKLAESSVAQGAELNRERDVRRRAEEDAQLKQQLLTQALDEKIRLGRDLHDGIIQSLYAVGLTIETVRALVKSNPAEADRRLEQGRSGINDAIREVRAYITGLATENLRRGGFTHALAALLAELKAGREVKFDIQIDPEAAALLTPDQSLQALQIAREAASNALRHGGASLVTVRMHKGDNAVGLLIQDNGKGFNPAETREGGHGLLNMRARAEGLGAKLRVTSLPDEGARILATLPILEPIVG